MLRNNNLSYTEVLFFAHSTYWPYGSISHLDVQEANCHHYIL